MKVKNRLIDYIYDNNNESEQMQPEISYSAFLKRIQSEFSEKYAEQLSLIESDDENDKKLKEYISNYISDNNFKDDKLNHIDLTTRIFEDMRGYSFLDKWLYKEGVEEINIDAWDNITIKDAGGRIIHLQESFASPTHALVIVQKMLRKSNVVLNESSPTVLGTLESCIRIAAVCYPIISEDVGVTASIRKIKRNVATTENYLKSNFATRDMLDFLPLCVQSRISIVFSGAVGSGKTTAMGYALFMGADNDTRVITIEEECQEFKNDKYDKNGRKINSSQNWITRPHANSELAVTAENLLDLALRFDPDIIGIGEMRSSEAAVAVDAANTGSAVVSTTHSDSAESTYSRLLTLAKRKYPKTDDVLLLKEIVKAFPIIVYVRQYKKDKTRRIVKIIEGLSVTDDGSTLCNTLFGYDRRLDDFKHINSISKKLADKMAESEISEDVISKYYYQQVE